MLAWRTVVEPLVVGAPHPAAPGMRRSTFGLVLVHPGNDVLYLVLGNGIGHHDKRNRRGDRELAKRFPDNT